MYRFQNVTFIVGDRVFFTYHKVGHNPNRRGIVEKMEGNALTIKDETVGNKLRIYTSLYPAFIQIYCRAAGFLPQMLGQ